MHRLCRDKRAACAVIGGYLKAARSYTLSECEIECCTDDNCNGGVDGPGQCNACAEANAASCVAVQQNQTCLTDWDSLGTAHCGSAAIKYQENKFGDSVKTGFIRGCFNCTDKKAACFTLGGYLKTERRQTLLQCDIECCNSSNCNNQAPTLTQDAITVFTPDAAGPSQCQECFDDDEVECFQKQNPQTCSSDSSSLGTTHCGSAKIKYWSVFGVRDSVFRGCIDCADKKAACAAIGGFVKSQKRETLLDCEIECCTGNNCNGLVLPTTGLLTCSYCIGQDAASCSKDQIPQACSLGTTHCGSAVGKIGYRSGLQDIFYRGCFNCADKKEACFALGGFLKGHGRKNRITLLQCEIDCCTGGNCNTQTFPSLSKNAVNVFTPAASGPKECNQCLENNATSCSKNQQTVICATNPHSLGTSHCGSAVGKYLDLKGTVVDGFIRGCLNCADKKAACAAIGGFLKGFRAMIQLECTIECCTDNNCNTQIPSLSKGVSPTGTTSAASQDGGQILFSGLLVFATSFRVIVHHV